MPRGVGREESAVKKIMKCLEDSDMIMEGRSHHVALYPVLAMSWTVEFWRTPTLRVSN